MYRTAAVALLLGAGMVCEAGPIIVGVAYTGGSAGPLYQINTLNGAATGLGTSAPPYQMTGGPQSNTAIVWSPVNAYRENVFTGQTTLIPSYMSGGAYDSGTNVLVGAAALPPTYSTFSLITSPMIYCTQVPSCVDSSGNSYSGPLPPNPTGVAPLGFPASMVLDYAPSTGLLGLFNNTLYSVNETTGTAAIIASLILPPSANLPTPIAQEFAYDDATGKLIVAAFSGTASSPGPQHGLYSVDINTGLGTLLTDQGPEFVGLARVDAVPEPPTLLLFALGFGLVLVARARS